jgi:hypothetical protein
MYGEVLKGGKCSRPAKIHRGAELTSKRHPINSNKLPTVYNIIMSFKYSEFRKLTKSKLENSANEQTHSSSGTIILEINQMLEHFNTALMAPSKPHISRPHSRAQPAHDRL